MIKLILISLVVVLIGCSNSNQQQLNNSNSTENLMEKVIDSNLPTIGILLFDGVIMNEVIAPIDVFSKSTSDHQPLFNVVTIAKESKIHVSAEGVKIIPDFTIKNAPKLKVLVVPSTYHPEQQTADTTLVQFIQQQNQQVDYVASHCAGAFLVGESGIANGKNIVTYVTGGPALQEAYPNLNVADDATTTVVEDGKFISSNGNLVSYLASLDLLETLTNSAQRKYVEEYILLDRLREQP